MHAWLRFRGSVPPAVRQDVVALLETAGIRVLPEAEPPRGLGVLVFEPADHEGAATELRSLGCTAEALAVALGEPAQADAAACWTLLEAGAVDLLRWPALPAQASDVASRIERHEAVLRRMDSPAVRRGLAGLSTAWRAALRGVVEAACFSTAPVLINGETGTGKEQLARLIHELGERAAGGRFVVLDCTTIAPELSGSEFFGHERGAFTGAAGPREGAFALAHRGTLFLDEVGELPLPLQAQLLRVVQERQYKRLGGNSWQDSDFRLVCATHRDLEAAVAEGRFRADLYHRLAGWRCVAPPLRERRDDVLPLARYFLRQLGQLDGTAAEVEIDPLVADYLLARDYPGNVRELRQLVQRLWQRHCGPGPLTAGDVPRQERPSAGALCWPDSSFESAIRLAVERGIGLNEIGQQAKEMAVRIALEREDQNVQRAAARLQVSDRLLQIRKKEHGAAGRAR